MYRPRGSGGHDFLSDVPEALAVLQLFPGKIMT